ncbi:unnamed protein product, partial [Rotaria sp. Silwood2]
MIKTKHPNNISNTLHQELVTGSFSTSTALYSPSFSSVKMPDNFSQFICSNKASSVHQVIQTCKTMLQKQGVYSTIHMESAGFKYIGKQDTVRCDICQLEVSGWTLNMIPFTIHAQHSPKCTFIRSILFDARAPKTEMVDPLEMNSTLTNDKKSSKCQKIEVTQENFQPHRLIEIDRLKQIRKRTFSHWPHRTSPSSQQMIKAGFFSCNVEDRAICLYCNIICHAWTSNT